LRIQRGSVKEIRDKAACLGIVTEHLKSRAGADDLIREGRDNPSRVAVVGDLVTRRLRWMRRTSTLAAAFGKRWSALAQSRRSSCVLDSFGDRRSMAASRSR
jgi:hypothetical protein